MTRIAATVVVTLLLSVAIAGAEPRNVQRADALFRQGRALMKAGDFRAACPKLEESYRLDPAAGTAVNVGDCLDKIGKVGGALLAYQAAQKLLAPGDPRITPVTLQIATLEKRVPRLTITLAVDAPEGTTATRDGKPVDFLDLGKPIGVNPGELVIVVTAPGHESVTSNLTLAEGEARHFVAEVGEPVRGGPVKEPPLLPEQSSVEARDAPPDDGSTMRTSGYVLGAAGVISTAFGVVSYADFLAKRSQADEVCPGENCADEKTKAEYDRLKLDVNAAGTRAAWGLGLGLTAIAGGVALIVLAPDGAAPKDAVRATPTVSAHGYGFQMGGTW